MKRFSSKDRVTMNFLKAMGYSNRVIADMFKTTVATVYYNTNEKARNKKREYNKAYQEAIR